MFIEQEYKFHVQLANQITFEHSKNVERSIQNKAVECQLLIFIYTPTQFKQGCHWIP